jgi:CHAD domain-containing protein
VEELARRRHKLRRRGKTLPQLSAAERHRLRIRAKKIRYAMEFFADLFTAQKQTKRCKAALAALVELQDALGSLNDVVTREALASHVVTSQSSHARGGAAKAFAAGVIYGTQDAHVAELLATADRARDRFLDAKPFWH